MVRTMTLIRCSAVAVLLVLAGCGSDGPDEGDEVGAEVICQQFIDGRLKAPSTAEYDLAASGFGDDWTATGTVDSENSFGANIRSNVTCKVHYLGNDEWRLVALSGIN